jgi:hypothetical protein
LDLCSSGTWQSAFFNSVRDPLFGRDSRGSEADLLIDIGGRISVLEIKSGRTYQDEWMRGVRSVMDSMPDPAAAAGRVVYGGDPGDPAAGRDGMSWRDVGAFVMSVIGGG